jgi:predicted aspartyl protease
MGAQRFFLFAAIGFGICGGFAAVSKDEVVQIPFTFEDNSIFVQVKIGDKGPFAMMLDTDSDPSVVDLSFAKSIELKLRQVGGNVSGGGTGRPQAYLTKLQAVEVGGFAVKELSALAIDLSAIRGELKKDVQGILGNDFLAGRIVQIDYPKGVLRFYRSSRVPADATSSRVTFPFKFDEDGSSIVLDGVAINGKKILATIDTGSNGSFKLTPAAVETLGLTEVAAKGQAANSVGYKGTAQNTSGTLDLISVGSIEIKSPDVVFFGKGSGRDHRPWGLNIGNAFLKDYVLTIDYPKKLITLEKPLVDP